ncbi:IQ domain-containing protein E isoform X2 [Conger conger]|nr:IQ domain-containing protein E isoform X2 [Conger conger]
MSDTEKQPRKKKPSSKPPPSPRSPYLSSANLHPKKAAVWRSLKSTGMMHNENPTARAPREFWLASLKSGLALSQPMKADYDITSARMSTSTSTPEYLKEAFGMKKPKHSRTSSNGYIPGTPDFKEKEDMYDEILDLKKCLQAQKSESDLMKTKLRKLEEDNSKKEKQIEQLLNPTKGSEYTRAFVDKRNDGSAVTNGLKQKILKLEQQCKEKDSALVKLQSDLKTTNMEEMKIALETYFEEIQRLKVLLASAETAERSNRAERKESLKQHKALNSSILRLSKNTKQLHEENKSLREELERATETPASTARGYSEWSKQRLVRRITELEKKPDDSGRPQSAKEPDPASGPRASHVSTVAPSADAAVQGVTATPSGNDTQECARLRGLLKKIREERAGLQASLADRNAEIKLLSTEQAAAAEEVKRLKTFELEASRHKEDIEKLTVRVKSLEKELEEERRLKAELEHNYQSLKVASSGDAARQFQHGLGQTPESSAPSPLSAQCGHRVQSETEDRAARTIQRHWHQHRSRNGAEYSEEDLVIIQSAIRGHLTRRKQLTYFKDLGRNRLQKGQQRESTESSTVQGDQDDDVVTLLQAALRGHLTRCRFITNSVSSGPESQITAPTIKSSVPTPAPRKLLSAIQSYQSDSPGVSNATGSDEDEIEEDIPDVTEMDTDGNCNSLDSNLRSSSRQKAAPARLDLHQPTDSEAAKAGDSDDSDDIIVSPSRPVRRKDLFF